MNPQDWKVIESLFHRVIDLEPSEREAIYRSEEISEEYRRSVEDLVASDPQTEDRHLEMIQGEVQRAEEPLNINRVGEQIAGYELIRELGRGGQGVVYLARRRDDELRGQVAIKILQGSLRARDLQQRFRQERHILSGLEHPNIARFLDAGTTPDGWLFLVLEAVEGEAIDRYCQRNELSLGARLDLFCRAAGAVQAAHRQLIIHRDIKASNLLVTEEGVPKLLDFGIAKWLDGQSPLAETQPGSHHLTPEAASPEQVLGENLTTATDIYSLGLLLYRLLTDQSAYTFETRTPSEIERVVCHGEPILPSLAAGRSELRGDLDAIVLQALRKNPDERYASVEAMIEDIRRYRRREPIRARPAGFLYLAGKFIRRHHRPLLSLVFIALASLFFIDRIRQERDRAIANEEMLLGLFSLAAQGGPETILERMGEYLPELDDLDLKAQFMSLLGPIYHSLDRHEEAQMMLQKALEIRRRLGPAQDKAIAVDLLKLGSVFLDIGKHREARPFFQDALATAIALEADGDWLAATCRARLAQADYELERFDAAIGGAQAALSRFDQLLDGDSPSPEEAIAIANAYDTMAAVYYQRQQYAEAESIYRSTIKLLIEAVGPDHLAVETLWNNLGMTLRKQKRFDEAIDVLQETIRINKRELQVSSIRLGIRLMNLGNIYRRQGQIDLALEACQEALRMTTQVAGPKHANIPGIKKCIERAEVAKESSPMPTAAQVTGSVPRLPQPQLSIHP